MFSNSNTNKKSSENYISIVEMICAEIKGLVGSMIQVAGFDRTFKAVISKKLSDNQYEIIYQKKYYHARSNGTYKSGDVVYVCAPQNNWSELYIVPI